MAEPKNLFNELAVQLGVQYDQFYADNLSLDKAYREGTIKGFVGSAVHLLNESEDNESEADAEGREIEDGDKPGEALVAGKDI